MLHCGKSPPNLTFLYWLVLVCVNMSGKKPFLLSVDGSRNPFSISGNGSIFLVLKFLWLVCNISNKLLGLSHIVEVFHPEDGNCSLLKCLEDFDKCCSSNTQVSLIQWKYKLLWKCTNKALFFLTYEDWHLDLLLSTNLRFYFCDINSKAAVLTRSRKILLVRYHDIEFETVVYTVCDILHSHYQQV